MLQLKVFGLVTVVAGGLGLATAANAAPLGYGPFSGDALIEHVAGGCGPGFHPNPWGRCRPNDRGYGYGYGGPRGPYGGRPAYGYGGGYERGYGGYDRPRRFYDGY